MATPVRKEQIALFIFCICILSTLGCGVLRPKPKDSIDHIKYSQQLAKNIQPEDSSVIMKEVGENWLYGQGVGETTVAVGTVVAFPPAAIWFLGNAIISFSGYEPLGVSYFFEEENESWDLAYDAVVSTPGRILAGATRNEYRSKDVIRKRMNNFILKAERQPDRHEVAQAHFSRNENL